MNKRNLTKERSKRRWQLAYQAIALVAVLGLYPLTVLLLNHPLLGSNPALLRLERWNLAFLKSTAASTAGWTSLFLVLMMLRSIWQIYSLMGVHLKQPARAGRRAVAKRKRL